MGKKKQNNVTFVLPDEMADNMSIAGPGENGLVQMRLENRLQRKTHTHTHTQKMPLFVALYNMRSVTVVMSDEMPDVSIAGLQWIGAL